MPHFAFTERVMRSMFDCNRLIGEGCSCSNARNSVVNAKTKARRMLARANRSLINIPPLQLAGQGASSLGIPQAGYEDAQNEVVVRGDDRADALNLVVSEDRV